MLKGMLIVLLLVNVVPLIVLLEVIRRYTVGRVGDARQTATSLKGRGGALTCTGDSGRFEKLLCLCTATVFTRMTRNRRTVGGGRVTVRRMVGQSLTVAAC